MKRDTAYYRALNNAPMGQSLPLVDPSVAGIPHPLPVNIKQNRQPASYKIVLDTNDASATSSGANEDRWTFNLTTFFPAVRGRIVLDQLQLSTGGTTNHASLGRVRITGFGNHPLSFDSATKSGTSVFSLLPVRGNTVVTSFDKDFAAEQAYPCPRMQLASQNIEVIVEQAGYTGGATAKIPILRAQLILTIFDDGSD